MSNKVPDVQLVREFVFAAHTDLGKVQEMLEKHPALLDIPNPDTDETALGAAAHMGRRQIAEFLLGEGAEITICAAAMLGRRQEVAEFLTADPLQANARGAHGIPLMFHVALSGDIKLAELILENGGGEGIGSALHAAIAVEQVEMVRWLLGKNIPLDTPNYQGHSPLAVAEARGAVEIVDLLRTAGAES